QPHGPELGADLLWIDGIAVEVRGSDERIIRWDRIVRRTGRMRVRRQTAWPLVHIDAQNSAEKVVCDLLSVAIPVVAQALIAEGNVEITIRPEMQVATIVG